MSEHESARRTGSNGQQDHQPFSQIMQDASRVADSMTTMADHTRDVIRTEMEMRPYAVIAVAAAIGFVLGGGLSSRVGRGLLRVGGMAALRTAMREFEEGEGSGRMMSDENPYE